MQCGSKSSAGGRRSLLLILMFLDLSSILMRYYNLFTYFSTQNDTLTRDMEPFLFRITPFTQGKYGVGVRDSAADLRQTLLRA